MKKILACISIAFLLTACSSDESGDSVATENTKTYEGSNFTVKLPLDWEVIEPVDFTSAFPAQTQVAFLNNVQHEVYTANANVTVRAVEEGTVTADFAKNMLGNAKSSLLEFVEIGNSEKIVMQGENEISGIIYEFQGKKSASNSIVTFRELYLVIGDQGIIFTASHLPDESENVVNQLNEMLDSFALK